MCPHSEVSETSNKLMTKRYGLLRSGVLLQHDNARPHVSRATSKSSSIFRNPFIHLTLHRVIIVTLDYLRALAGSFYNIEVKTVVYAWLCSERDERFLPERKHKRSAGGNTFNVEEIMLKMKSNEPFYQLLECKGCLLYTSRCV